MSTSRNAIVTGSAAGLGRAIVVRLAEDGYNVVVNDLPNKQDLIDEVVAEIKAKGKEVIAFPGDAASEDDVRAMIAKCVETFGSLDVMVCNAGTAFVKSLLDTTVEDVNYIFNVNFRAAFVGYRLAAEQMIKQGKGGRIIGAASATAKKGFPLLGAYSATKFAIRGLTQSAAQEWGAHGITVNAYCPGVIWTPLTEALGEALSASVGASLGQKDADVRTVWANASALGRVGAPVDIAGLVSFLASEHSAFITGQSFLVDGGTLFD